VDLQILEHDPTGGAVEQVSPQPVEIAVGFEGREREGEEAAGFDRAPPDRQAPAPLGTGADRGQTDDVQEVVADGVAVVRSRQVEVGGPTCRAGIDGPTVDPGDAAGGRIERRVVGQPGREVVPDRRRNRNSIARWVGPVGPLGAIDYLQRSSMAR